MAVEARRTQPAVTSWGRRHVAMWWYKTSLRWKNSIAMLRLLKITLIFFCGRDT